MKGQTLIETLLALVIAIIVVTSVTSAVLASLKNAEYSRNQNLAQQYAQQGIDYIQQLRDTDTTTYQTLSGGSGDQCPTSGITGGCTINGFKRTIVFNRGNCAAVSDANLTQTTVTVSWSDGKCSPAGSTCHAVQLVSCLSDQLTVPKL